MGRVGGAAWWGGGLQGWTKEPNTGVSAPPGQSPAALWAQVPLYDVDQRVGLCDLQGPNAWSCVFESNFRAAVVPAFLNEPPHASPFGESPGEETGQFLRSVFAEAHRLPLLRCRLCVHGPLQGGPGRVSAE